MGLRPLAIRVHVDPARAREWQRRAIEDLRAKGHDVRIAIAAPGRPLPLIVTALLTLERLVARGTASTPSGVGFGDAWRAAAANEPPGFQPDLVLDLTNGVAAPGPVRTLRVLYSGSTSEEYGLLSLLHGVAPALGIRDSASPGRVKSLYVALERPFWLTQSMDAVYRRLANFVVDAVTTAGSGAPLGGGPATGPDPMTGWTARDSLAVLHARATSAIKRLTLRPPHWFVGWRRAGGQGIRDSLQIPHGGWTRLPDDGQRFYADPFLARHGGRDWLFVEEFPFATGKGILSVVEIGPDGPLGVPRPVLERPHHLSYPFVFEARGAVWMIPEGAASARVELYRATDFPYAWELASVLIDGAQVADATLVAHQGRHYLFGASSDQGHSSWDALNIWSAPDFLGPWTALGDQPILIDARSARPAGHFFVRDGALWRPAQDCSTGYGAALAFARVDRLDPNGFSQSVQAVLRPNADWPGIGLHTHNLHNGLEVVDGCKA